MKDEWDMSVDPSTGSWDWDGDVVLASVRDLVACSDRDRTVTGTFTSLRCRIDPPGRVYSPLAAIYDILVCFVAVENVIE